jgi:hypothetical protein
LRRAAMLLALGRLAYGTHGNRSMARRCLFRRSFSPNCRRPAWSEVLLVSHVRCWSPNAGQLTSAFIGGQVTMACVSGLTFQERSRWLTQIRRVAGRVSWQTRHCLNVSFIPGPCFVHFSNVLLEFSDPNGTQHAVSGALNGCHPEPEGLRQAIGGTRSPRRLNHAERGLCCGGATVRAASSVPPKVDSCGCDSWGVAGRPPLVFRLPETSPTLALVIDYRK